jgi:hypothetical protein
MVAQQKLKLLKFSARQMASPSIGATQIIGSKFLDAGSPVRCTLGLGRSEEAQEGHIHQLSARVRVCPTQVGRDYILDTRIGHIYTLLYGSYLARFGGFDFLASCSKTVV